MLALAALGQAELQRQAIARVGRAQRFLLLDGAGLGQPEQALVEALHAFFQRGFHRRLDLVHLAAALADARRMPSHELPQTGVPLEMEHGLSSPFVSMPERGYGTRSSLVLSVQTSETRAAPAGWRVAVDEWTHIPVDGHAHAWNPQHRRSETLFW